MTRPATLSHRADGDKLAGNGTCIAGPGRGTVPGMGSRERENYFGEGVAERYDDSSSEMFDPAVIEPTVDFLAGLAGDGAALELGIGTGRVALPLPGAASRCAASIFPVRWWISSRRSPAATGSRSP